MFRVLLILNHLSPSQKMFWWPALPLVSVRIKPLTTTEGTVLHSTRVWLYRVFFTRQMSSHWVNLLWTHWSLSLYYFFWSRNMQNLGLLCWLMFSAIHASFNPFYAALFFWSKSFILPVIYLIKQLLSCNFGVKNLQSDRAGEGVAEKSNIIEQKHMPLLVYLILQFFEV